MPLIYLVAIAWIYVVLLIALNEISIVAGVMTFLFYCAFPLALLLYLCRSIFRSTKPKPQHQITSDSQAPTDTAQMKDSSKI